MSKNVGKTSALGDTWELKKAKGFSRIFTEKNRALFSSEYPEFRSLIRHAEKTREKALYLLLPLEGQGKGSLEKNWSV